MTDPTFLIDCAMKMAQWERAKGELRAFRSTVGAHHGGPDFKYRFKRYEELDKLVEDFIKQIEEECYHE